MFIPFSIKAATIEHICRGHNWNYDTDSITAQMKANINLDTIKDALINGTKLLEEWFPSEFYDSHFQMFISHSHNDEGIVKQLAGFLQENYGINNAYEKSENDASGYEIQVTM